MCVITVVLNVFVHYWFSITFYLYQFYYVYSSFVVSVHFKETSYIIIMTQVQTDRKHNPSE